MKTISNLKLLTLGLLATASAFVFTSCDEDEDPPAKPTASFTYVPNGREVAFTNTSTNATTYSWDFGDGETSTEQNPTHTYESYGKYTVKLTATGDGGTATSLPDELTLAKTSVVEIDGNVDEWSAIDPIATFAADGNPNEPSMTELKLDYDASNIYIYVKGTEDFRGFLDVFINADNDTLTGFASGTYRAFGADYLYEGDLANDTDADLLKHNGADQGWGWEVGAAAGGGFLMNDGIVTLEDGTKALEFAISRASLTGMSDEKIGFAVLDWKDPLNNEWYYIGSLPGSMVAKPLVYLNLTQ